MEPARALLADAWVVESIDAVPADFRGIAVTRSGRAWFGAWHELRQAPAGGEERVLAQRNRRESLLAETERAAPSAEQAGDRADRRRRWQAVTARDDRAELRSERCAPPVARATPRPRSSAALSGRSSSAAPRRTRAPARCAGLSCRPSATPSGVSPTTPSAALRERASGWRHCARRGRATMRSPRRPRG